MKIINYKDLGNSFYEYHDFAEIGGVWQIIKEVRADGDEAVKKYAEKFGDGQLTHLELTKVQIESAVEQVDISVIEAIKDAISNVRTFSQEQLTCLTELETQCNGAILGHKLIPLKRTGAYVPGGNYPLPSSAVMSVVPAKVAGVEEVIVCSPKIKPETIAAAHLAGADRIFNVGGVQAIAAMAYGTQTIPAVDKITGPGNKYVTAAKKEVYGACGIDFLAGPSEVLIVADDTARADFVAADMLAQAEHDTDARAYLVTTSEKFAQKVSMEVDNFLQILSTADIAKQAISKSMIIVVDDIEQAVEISNKKAPEHLEICFDGLDDYMDKFTNYGSLFVGNYSAEVLGDYCSGTNHVLPTNGVARYSGGLSVFDFIKIQTFQKISQNQELLSIASKLANIEGLMAHKLAADLRM